MKLSLRQRTQPEVNLTSLIEVDAKSILGILLLAAAQGSSVIIKCAGEDEKEAIEAIEKLFVDRFDEDS